MKSIAPKVGVAPSTLLNGSSALNMTFDDHHLLDCLPLKIDAIQQDSEALAGASLERLIGMINKKAPTSATVPARLHWRSRK